VHELIHTLQKAGILSAKFTTAGSNTAQERIGTEQIQVTGNCYMPTGNTLLHMTVRAQATFRCANREAHIFSILNSTKQRNAHVSVR